MTKVDIISGFLGAGKTTFIKELIEKVFAGEKLVLIENEFGEIGIDGGFLQDAGIEITEMNSGCICCTLVGDFSVALKKVLDEYHPDHVIIEPSGVGKLSDVAAAIENVKEDADIEIEGRITVVDGKKAKMYLDNFGEFFENQVEHASTIVISRTQNMTDEKIEACVHLLREKNDKATIISTPWDQLSGDAICHALEHGAEIEGLFEHHHDQTRSVHAVITMSIITIMTRSVHAAITMSIITTMTRSADVDITIMTMMRSADVDITIMTMTRSVDVDITIMTMMKNAAADVDIIMIITIIMQMKYLQAGVRKLRTSTQRKSWITY